MSQQLAAAASARTAAGGIHSAGTPKTLEEAIARGVREIEATAFPARLTDDDKATIIHRHVRDFLAQRFSIAMLTPTSPQDLWALIFPNERRQNG